MTTLTKEDIQEVKEAHKQINWTVDIRPQKIVEGFLETDYSLEETNFIIGDERINDEIASLRKKKIDAIRYRIIDENGVKQGGDYVYLVNERNWNKMIENHMEDIKYDKNLN